MTGSLVRLGVPAGYDAMTVDDVDRRLLHTLQTGLLLTPRPYREAGLSVGLSETEVMARLRRLLASGVVKRLGVIVRHLELGYCANAMIVWDVPDNQVQAVGERLAARDMVRLCYRRPRRLPHWRYNLFCMIHGRDRELVRRQLDELIEQCELQAFPYEVLFSRRRFKQRGARYDPVVDQTCETPGQ